METFGYLAAGIAALGLTAYVAYFFGALAGMKKMYNDYEEAVNRGEIIEKH